MVERPTVGRLFSVTVDLYFDHSLFVSTEDAQGDGLSYRAQLPPKIHISRFEEMMSVATKEMLIQLREFPLGRSKDPRQTSLTEEDET